MKTRMLREATVLGIVILVLSGCTSEQKAKINASDVANSKPSDYYPSQPIDKNRRVFVFVHGIFGDAYKTWQNDNGTNFFDLLKKDTSGVFTGSDVFVFGFPSDFFGVSYTPDEAARSLATAMRISRVTDYQQIIFVAHSMGGLVTLRYLVLNPEVAAKVPLAFFYSTPQAGSNIAKLGSIFSKNPGLAAMFPDKNPHAINLYLGSLDEDWKTAIFRGRISTVVRCAYEKKPILGQLIVDEASATRFCQGSSYPIPKDHIDMVKPVDIHSDSYRALFDAMSLISTPSPSAVGAGVNMQALFKGASVSFNTNNDDKDYDTWVNTQILCNRKSVAGRSEPYGKFPDHSVNGPFALTVTESLSIDKSNASCTFVIRIIPHGHDTWRFSSKLDITFADESVKTFVWNNIQLDQDNPQAEFPLILTLN